ncbi:MAG: HIRAN domain-containing protein [Aquificaceae bacterium]|nr:HIRAN domain-containing protein [Aquificaceae bacterium]
MWSRRELLGAVWLLPVGDRLSTKKASREVLLLRTRLAGYRYYSADSLYPYMKLGEELSLRREPYNPYDHKAVEVLWKGHKIGYLPREDNSVIAQLMDRGENLRAIISELAGTERYWERIRIEVYLVVS